MKAVLESLCPLSLLSSSKPAAPFSDRPWRPGKIYVKERGERREREREREEGEERPRRWPFRDLKANNSTNDNCLC